MGLFNKLNIKNLEFLNSTKELNKYEYFTLGFPLDMLQTINKIIEYIPNLTSHDVWFSAHAERITYSLSEQTISFPYRVYFDEIEEDIFFNMRDIEKLIINCIYSRSFDGYVREKHIRRLLSMEYPKWAIPYIVKICDEYIVEIIQLVYENLKDKNTDDIKNFCGNNYNSFCKSYNRMISYWNEFYRWDCYRYENYVGRKLFLECFGASRKMN